jgi:hypothetical protein
MYFQRHAMLMIMRAGSDPGSPRSRSSPHAREALAAEITKAIGPVLIGKIPALTGSSAGEHIGEMYQAILKAIKAG